MDISQLIGEYIWATCLLALEGKSTKPKSNRSITDFARKLIGYMKHEAGQNKPELFFIDHLTFQWFYPYFILHYRQDRFAAFFNSFTWSDVSLWYELIESVVELHQCLIDPALKSNASKATYLPRNFRSLEFVNYFYMPTFELFFHLEELHLKAQIDIDGLTQFPLLCNWVKFMNDVNPVKRVKQFIGTTMTCNALLFYQKLGSQFIQTIFPDMELFLSRFWIKPTYIK